MAPYKTIVTRRTVGKLFYFERKTIQEEPNKEVRDYLEFVNF